MLDNRVTSQSHVSTKAIKTLADVREENESEHGNTNTTIISLKSAPEPSQLHLLAINGNKVQLQDILSSKKCNVNETDHMGRTPLIYSVLGDRVDCVLLLLKAGADINHTDVDQRSALHWASYQGNHKLVKILLAKGADNDARDKEGRTVLHLCISHDNVKVLQMLLQSMKREVIDTPDNKGMTALCWSVFYERFDYVKLLLKYGAAPSCLDGEQRSVLHWTSENKSIAVIKSLCEGNSTLINWPDSEKRTVLHMSVAQSNYKLIEFVLSVPDIDINCRDKIGRTPLHWAAVLKDAKMVKLLLDKGADHSMVDLNGVSALHYAAQHEDSFDTVQVLVDKGVHDKPDKDQGTALMWAAFKGHQKVVDLLLQKHCTDVNAIDVHGHTALHLAVQAGHLACVKILIANGASVDKMDGKHHIPLFYACASGHIDIVNELLHHGSSTNLDDRDLEGRSPLHYAAMVDRTDIIKKLIQSRLDPNMRDNAGRAPLHFAAYGGFVHCMNVLLENQAAVNLQDNDGCTPLHWASRSGSLGAVKLLVKKYKADVNIFEKSTQEFTPLDYAILEDHQDVAFYLTENNACTVSTIKELSATRIQALWKGYQFRKEFNETRQHYLNHDRIRKAASDNNLSVVKESSSVCYEQKNVNVTQINICSGSSSDVTTVKDIASNLDQTSQYTEANLLPRLQQNYRRRSNSDMSAISQSSRSSYQVGDKNLQRGPKFSLPSNNPMSLRKISTGASSVGYSPRSTVDESRSKANSPVLNSARQNSYPNVKSSSSSSSYIEKNLYLYPNSYNRQYSEQSVFTKDPPLPSWMNNANQLSQDTNYRHSPISSSGSSDVVGNTSQKLLSERNNVYRKNYSRHISEPRKNPVSSTLESHPGVDVKPLNSSLPSLIRKTTKTEYTDVSHTKDEDISLRSMPPTNSIDIFATTNSDKPWKLFRRDQKRINIIRHKTEAAVKIQKLFRNYQKRKRKGIDNDEIDINPVSVLGDLPTETSVSLDELMFDSSEEEDEDGLQEVAALVIQLAWRQFLKNKLVSQKNISSSHTNDKGSNFSPTTENVKHEGNAQNLSSFQEESDVPFAEESSSLDSSYEENKLRLLKNKKKLVASSSFPLLESVYSNPMTKKRSRKFSLKKRFLHHSSTHTKENTTVTPPTNTPELPSLKIAQQSLSKSEVNAIKSGKPKLFLRGKTLKN